MAATRPRIMQVTLDLCVHAGAVKDSRGYPATACADEAQHVQVSVFPERQPVHRHLRRGIEGLGCGSSRNVCAIHELACECGTRMCQGSFKALLRLF